MSSLEIKDNKYKCYKNMFTLPKQSHLQLTEFFFFLFDFIIVDEKNISKSVNGFNRILKISKS